jgi:hypothetical protein
MKTINNIYRGGMLAGHRTYIVALLGILTAAGAYLMGDNNLPETASAIFPLLAIYFLRKGVDDGK